MKKTTLIILLHLLLLHAGNAQTFEVDSLYYRGNTGNYINLVIMGDGYTSVEQTKFISDAQNLANYLFSQAPWSNYAAYFNVFAIRVISTQSGAKHPNTSSDCASASPTVPVSSPTTYFGCSFDSYGIHRLITPTNTGNIVNVLAANFPNYDQVLILANTPYYGGAGGTYATSTVHSSSSEIVAHEIGHSFAALADEYYAGDSYAAEKVNMTKQTNPSLVRWKNWVGTNGVGVNQYCCGGNSALWYKPHTSCKMQALNNPYCSVCSEAIVERIHSLVNPIVSYTPANSSVSLTTAFVDFKLTELMKPLVNTLNISWKLDGVQVSTADSFRLLQQTLPTGSHTLTAGVYDSTALLRVDNHATLHVSTVTWTIQKTNTGMSLTSANNKISCAVFPNPATNILHISFTLEKANRLSIDLISTDGKMVQHVVTDRLVTDVYEHDLHIESLASGQYILLLKGDDFTQSIPIIKE